MPQTTVPAERIIFLFVVTVNLKRYFSGMCLMLKDFRTILARITDALTGEPIGLHQTWLTLDGSGKAPVERPRLLLKGVTQERRGDSALARRSGDVRPLRRRGYRDDSLGRGCLRARLGHDRRRQPREPAGAWLASRR